MNILIFTNILTPYRIAFFDKLNNELNENGDLLKVYVMSETEENRNWYYEDYKRKYTRLLKGKRIGIGGYKVNINQGIDQMLTDVAPDIVIAAGSYIHPSLWILIQRCNVKKIPILFWSESHLNTERKYSKVKTVFRDSIRRSVYKRFNGFCYAGKLSKEFICKYARDESKYIFLPNLVDDRFYSTSAENQQVYKETKEMINSNEEIRNYIIPARLSPDKGIMEFLQLLRQVKTKKTVRIFIAGDGELEQEIKNYSRDNNLNVSLLGFMSREQMRCLYQLVDGFILPSKVDPNPLTCIEALWSGLPMLVSDHVGNYPEVIKDGLNGYVFSYEDDAERTISTFLNQDVKWYKHAHEISREIAETCYSMNTVTKEFIQKLRSF